MEDEKARALAEDEAQRQLHERFLPIDDEVREELIEISGFGDEDDEDNYKIKAGGMRIRVSKNSSKGLLSGTLGCFARLKTNNKVVILSAHHVLMPREFFDNEKRNTDNDLGVGQPTHNTSSCCVYNEIATTKNGNKTFDCAIAEIKPDLKYAAKVRRITRSDGTVELSGEIKGSEPGKEGDIVWKVGATTGLTRGIVSKADPVTRDLTITPIPPFKKFADHGDSGAVVVKELTSKVIGLLRNIDKEDGPLGVAKPIGTILSLMEIEILVTPEGQMEVSGDDEEERLGDVRQPAPVEVFAAVADRLRTSDAGTELLALYRRHKSEIENLVNHCRPVTVAWQRGQGPAFLAAIMRSIREPIYQLPMSVGLITREAFARRLHESLTRHDSASLRADLAAHGETLISHWLTCSTFDELIQAWENGYASRTVRLPVNTFAG